MRQAIASAFSCQRHICPQGAFRPAALGQLARQLSQFPKLHKITPAYIPRVYLYDSTIFPKLQSFCKKINLLCKSFSDLLQLCEHTFVFYYSINFQFVHPLCTFLSTRQYKINKNLILSSTFQHYVNKKASLFGRLCFIPVIIVREGY